MSVRKILENFIVHVKEMEENDEDSEKLGFLREFQNLKQKSSRYSREGTYPASEGEKEVNRRKNRYRDILPFDYTRVTLEEINGEEGSDYINANFIKGATGHQTYIASQGPLPATVNDFWRMVWQYNVNIIVMASNEFEAGKLKCQRYWPLEDEEKHFGDITVTLAEEEYHNEFQVRKISVINSVSKKSRVIHQFHYTTWPDHGVPTATRSLLDMIALIREYHPQHDPPIVIHCSAGCGRTGTICAIDYAWTLLKTGKLTPKFSIYKIISEMRKQRPSIVQAKDQYVISHKAVEELFLRHLEVMNQHLYENVDNIGQPLSPIGDSPTSDGVHIPYDSSYEDLVGPTSPIVRIELAPPDLLPKRRPVSERSSPTHKAVKSTVEKIIKSESDNDIKTAASHGEGTGTKFNFNLEEMDPSSSQSSGSAKSISPDQRLTSPKTFMKAYENVNPTREDHFADAAFGASGHTSYKNDNITRKKNSSHSNVQTQPVGSDNESDSEVELECNPIYSTGGGSEFDQTACHLNTVLHISEDEDTTFSSHSKHLPCGDKTARKNIVKSTNNEGPSMYQVSNDGDYSDVIVVHSGKKTPIPAARISKGSKYESVQDDKDLDYSSLGATSCLKRPQVEPKPKFGHRPEKPTRKKGEKSPTSPTVTFSQGSEYAYAVIDTYSPEAGNHEPRLQRAMSYDGKESSQSAMDEYSEVMVQTNSHQIQPKKFSYSQEGLSAPVIPPKIPQAYEISKTVSDENLHRSAQDSPEAVKSGNTISRMFKQVAQKIGSSTWPPRPDSSNFSKISVSVMFKDKDISFGQRVQKPAGPRSSPNISPMPAPRHK